MNSIRFAGRRHPWTSTLETVMRSVLLLTTVTSALLLSLGCKPIAECWAVDGTAQRCAGSIVIGGEDTPTFDLDETSEVVPNHLAVLPISECLQLQEEVWEVHGFELSDLPLSYGEIPAGAEGTVATELEAGRAYHEQVEATSGWRTQFIAGDLAAGDPCSEE